MLSKLIFAFAIFASDTENGGGGLLSVNVGLAFWTIVTFLLLLLILGKFAWKPILKSLDERENKIKESLEMAEQAKIEAKKIIEENQMNMRKAEEEARKILDENKNYAEQLKKQIIEESKLQANQLIEKANSEIERKKQEAFNELKNQVAELSIQVAEKLIAETLDKEKNAKLIDKFIDEVQKPNTLSGN